MKAIRSNRFLGLICACLILTFTLTGCSARKLAPSKQATLEVGTVGEYSVPYEELYFLATSYYEEGMTEEELSGLISENIVSNYAILTLCERMGVEYDKKELNGAVQAYMKEMIVSDFGSRSNYIKALRESGMTDNYIRFTVMVDILYSKLPTAMALKGELLADTDAVCKYVKDNFVRTWHFMIANNEGDDAAANLESAEKALGKLKDGSTSMYKLIGSALNEDLLIPFDGYTFGKGSMEKAYEDAAFALEVEGYSEVISARGELADGSIADCYYIIQRLPLDEEFIKKNYDTIYESYESSVIGASLEKTKAELSFVPNDYFSSLDLTALESAGVGTDITAVITAGCCFLAVTLIVVGSLIWRKKFREDTARRLAAARSGK